MDIRLCLFLLGLSVSVTTHAAMWRNQDQVAHQLLLQKKYEKAFKQFKDQRWQAVAAYRAGHYKDAVAGFKTGSSIDDLYNLGNSLALSGDLGQAIKAYQAVLKRSPKHQDAKFNLELLEKLAQQQKQDEQQQKQDEQQQKQDEQQQKQDEQQQKQDEQQQKQDEQQQKQGEQQQKQGEQQQKQDEQQQKQDEQQQKQDEQQQKQGEASSQGDQEMKDWLKLIENDPEGLLRQKFLRDYQRELEGKS
jgi:Ca-activated chloride channel family protein